MNHIQEPYCQLLYIVMVRKKLGVRVLKVSAVYRPHLSICCSRVEKKLAKNSSVQEDTLVTVWNEYNKS